MALSSAMRVDVAEGSVRPGELICDEYDIVQPGKIKACREH